MTLQDDDQNVLHEQSNEALKEVTCPHCSHGYQVTIDEFMHNILCPMCKKRFNPLSILSSQIYEKINTPEFREKIRENIIESNVGVTHEEFVEGVRFGKMGFKCMSGEPNTLLDRNKRNLFNFMVIFYLLTPLLISALWAYFEGKRWLLLGIPISWIASLVSANLGKNTTGYLVLPIIGTWIGVGIHSYSTIFLLIAFWGALTYQIADQFQMQFALQSLIENPSLYYDAITNGKILIVHRDGD